MFTQLYKFTKNQAVHLRWVKFIVCKLYLNKTEKKVCQTIREMWTPMHNKELLLTVDFLRHDNHIVVLNKESLSFKD